MFAPLVLLVIFMVTTPLMTQGVKVDLPKASAKALPSTDDQPLIVTVNQTGHMYLNIATNPKHMQSKSTIQALVGAALTKDPKRKVYVKSDRQTEFGQVVQVMALLQKSGAPSVGIITQSPNDKLS